MNIEIEKFIKNYFPELSKTQKQNLDFMDEDEFYEWLHQRLLLFNCNKDTQFGVQAIYQWCQKGYESGIPLVHQLLSILAQTQLKKNPKMADDIINLIQDNEEKQKLLSQLQQSQQQQVNLPIQDSPKVLKAPSDKNNPGFFQNIITALRCWDKKK